MKRQVLTRIARRFRRHLWGASEGFRAAKAGVVLGPENFCYATRREWRVVVDVGVGNLPTFGPWIRNRTGAHVVLCDPTPKHLPGLRRWVSSRDGIDLVEAAVAAEDGVVEFFESDDEVSGSLDVSHVNRTGPGRVVQVEGLSLASLIDRARRHGDVSLVKLDLEGAEFAVFERSPNIDDVLSSVPEWLVEFHPAPQTAHSLSSVSSVRDTFHRLNFHEFSRNGVDYLFWRD